MFSSGKFIDHFPKYINHFLTYIDQFEEVIIHFPSYIDYFPGYMVTSGPLTRQEWSQKDDIFKLLLGKCSKLIKMGVL
ncbi:hypothetical protein QTL97_06425 [Sporosarcina thermotolerans]|uniref:Uncharacterized protein n=1 Tax=Sporosarcina thermotolerans TaxID=633404 RepID=A0AAW9AA58_9BACL|nr:hypothetical protein [Sporosarcina thermotolerans]MDW0116563.1 hypothetical protein [Sporosarcina thermotolerans]